MSRWYNFFFFSATMSSQHGLQICLTSYCKNQPIDGKNGKKHMESALTLLNEAKKQAKKQRRKVHTHFPMNSNFDPFTGLQAEEAVEVMEEEQWWQASNGGLHVNDIFNDEELQE